MDVSATTGPILQMHESPTTVLRGTAGHRRIIFFLGIWIKMETDFLGLPQREGICMYINSGADSACSACVCCAARWWRYGEPKSKETVSIALRDRSSIMLSIKTHPPIEMD